MFPIAQLKNLLATCLENAEQSRLAGDDANWQYWYDEAHDLNDRINEMLVEQRELEIAEEGRIAREQRISDIASGRYRVHGY